MSFLNFLKALPGAASRFGGAGRGIIPAAGVGGFVSSVLEGSSALDPLLQGSQYAQRQLEGLGVIPKPGQVTNKSKVQPEQQQRPIGTQAVLNGKPVYWGGDDYGWQLLNGTGSSATLNSLNAPGTQGRFIQDTAPRSPVAAQGGGGGFSGAGSFAPIDPYAAQNREYEQERARVEAMVKANPDMQKQAIADERAKVRDQGMAIWAAKYGAPGGLASQVKPGAVGYDAIQRGIGIQELPSLEKRAEFPWNQATQGPTPAVPMADAMLNPAGPGFIGGEGAPLVNFADRRFENMSPEEFQKLLNQYTKR